ncbi:potassium channel subfamily K member 9-like, partial [Lingula anatina]
YGHSTPKTVGGKIFCMFYALCGIPMTLVMFQSIGERLNTFVTFILKHVKKCLKLKNTEVSQTNLIMVGLNMCTIVLTSGAAAFSIYEDWPYLDSFYYCFITLTTIGFGDFVALQKSKALQSRPDYVAFSLIFILSGLAVLSANMNLLVLRFLTLNTEDERREELEAAVAARGAVRLEGDIIVPNGNVIQGQPQENPEYSDLASVCSCTCYNLRARASEKKHRLLSRSPGGGKGAHHVQMTSMNSNRDQDLHSCSDDVSLQFPYQYLSRKRASI